MKIQGRHLHEFTLPTFLCQGKRILKKPGELKFPSTS